MDVFLVIESGSHVSDIARQYAPKDLILKYSRPSY